MNQYKTLRQIDGQQYITVAEHEQIVQNLVNFNKAVKDIQSSMGTLGATATGLAEVLGGKELLKG